MVFRNLGHSVGKEISIDDKDFQLIDLYRYLDDVVSELTKIVISIGRRYNLEIPLNIHGRTTTTTSNITI
jgi:site-specific DNA-adenine methylase